MHSFLHTEHLSYLLVICISDLANELNLHVVDYVGEEEKPRDWPPCRAQYRNEVEAEG